MLVREFDRPLPQFTAGSCLRARLIDEELIRSSCRHSPSPFSRDFARGTPVRCGSRLDCPQLPNHSPVGSCRFRRDISSGKNIRVRAVRNPGCCSRGYISLLSAEACSSSHSIARRRRGSTPRKGSSTRSPLPRSWPPRARAGPEEASSSGLTSPGRPVCVT